MNGMKFNELYEDLPCIAEMDFTFHGRDFFYEYSDGTVYVMDGENIVYQDTHEKNIPESEIDAHIMKVFDAKLFDGKTFEEAESDITIWSSTYRKPGKYE